MSMNIPSSHITDAHKMVADGQVDFFELTPAGGGGTIRFKNDNDVTWRGNTYTGLPLQFSSNGMSVERGADMPKLVIGQPNLDLSLFKPLIYDGTLDGAVVLRYHVLLDNVIANASIFELFTYRVKRVEGYSRSQVTIQLASLSDSLGFSLPIRQYLPPAFPAVEI